MLKDLDKQFAILVMTKAHWTCALCARDLSANHEDLHCRHFWSHWNIGTRFDLENCDALCLGCLYYLAHDRRAFEFWKLGQLGRERYDAMRLRSQRSPAIDKWAVARAIAEGMSAIRAA